MQISTLRPGLLVVLKTSITGNVLYDSTDIDPEHTTEEGTRVATWETKKTVQNPEENEKATKLRSKVRWLIAGECARSNFGLLCPEDNEENLQAAINEAQNLVREFNTESEITRVALYTIIGRVAQDDVAAIRAINSEMRDLMDAMEKGIKSLDVEAVRDAANKAKSVSAMLSPGAQVKAEAAIKAVRSAARVIVKAGEAASVEIDKAVLQSVRTARTAFLDYSDGNDNIEAPAAVGRALDLEPEQHVVTNPVTTGRALEMEPNG